MTASSLPHDRGKPRAPSPEILARAGDVTRPTAPVPFCRDLEHLPGRSGPIAGLQTLAGMLLRGEAHFSGLARRHGPLFRHVVGRDPIVFVADPDLLYQVARNDDRVWSAALVWTHYFSGLLPGATGDGLLMLDQEPHRDARRLMQPAFSATAFAGYIDQATTIYDDAIRGYLRQRRVPFKAAVRRLFARVSAKIFMGLEGEEQAAELDRAMTQGWGGVIALFKRSPFSPGWRSAKSGMDRLWAMLRPRMAPDRPEGTDLLSRMAHATEGAAWLDEDARARLFIGTMFGAFDTTASGGASMAYLLARHPAWQERLRREVQSLSCERPGPEELKGLEQVDWVWKEALRMFPVAGQLARQALHDTTLGEHRIPAGTVVWAMSGTASRDPRWWTSPERFDPERFSPSRAEDKRHKATFLPFGAGAHTCIGAQLATAEIKAFWHALLTRCRIRLAKDYEARHTYTPIGILSGDVELIIEPL